MFRRALTFICLLLPCIVTARSIKVLQKPINGRRASLRQWSENRHLRSLKVPGDSPAYFRSFPTNFMLQDCHVDLLPNPNIWTVIDGGLGLRIKGNLTASTFDPLCTISAGKGDRLIVTRTRPLCRLADEISGFTVTQNGTSSCPPKAGTVDIVDIEMIPPFVIACADSGNYTISAECTDKGGYGQTLFDFEGVVQVEGDDDLCRGYRAQENDIWWQRFMRSWAVTGITED